MLLKPCVPYRRLPSAADHESSISPLDFQQQKFAYHHRGDSLFESPSLLAFPRSDTSFFPFADLTPTSFGAYGVVLLLTTAVFSPLEVMSIRLAIQRNHASAEYTFLSRGQRRCRGQCRIFWK
ncbi:hypothetical protein EV361DRAFT_623288 [Lentinula raphanica]|nr:hypothetical protein EV361DRAFT_623288 [Lentinula raphanica]